MNDMEVYKMQVLNRTFEEHNLLDTIENYEETMQAALECLTIGNMYLAEIYLKIGLSGGDINKTHDIVKKIIN